MPRSGRKKVVQKIHFVPIYPAKEGLVGFVSFILFDSFAIDGVGVHTNLKSGGYRLLFPGKKLTNGTSISFIRPLNAAIERFIAEEVTKVVSSVLYKNLPNFIPQQRPYLPDASQQQTNEPSA